MKLRCSPCNPLFLFGLLGIFIFLSHLPAYAQCRSQFAYQAFPPDNTSPSGKIEISLENAELGTYTFKMYKMEGVVTLVQTKQAPSPEKITFENLEPSAYFVKVEWGGSCDKILGGLKGIIISQRANEK